MSPHGTLSRSSAARMRNFVQATALRLVASILQESLPGTSGHALHRQHKARPAGARADLTCLRVLRRSMEPSRKGSWLRPTGRSRLIDGLQVSC